MAWRHIMIHLHHVIQADDLIHLTPELGVEIGGLSGIELSTLGAFQIQLPFSLEGVESVASRARDAIGKVQVRASPEESRCLVPTVSNF